MTLLHETLLAFQNPRVSPRRGQPPCGSLVTRVEAVGEVLATGGCQRGSRLGESFSAGAGLEDAPKRVESRRQWEGSAPDPAPQESGVGVMQKAFMDRGETSCPRCLISCFFRSVLSVQHLRGRVFCRKYGHAFLICHARKRCYKNES